MSVPSTMPLTTCAAMVPTHERLVWNDIRVSLTCHDCGQQRAPCYCGRYYAPPEQQALLFVETLLRLAEGTNG